MRKQLQFLLVFVLVFALLPFKNVKAEATNIALGKTYTASATETVRGQDVTAKQAFDGKDNTRFSAGQMKGIRGQASQSAQWLQIDLGKGSTVESIKVKFYLKVFSTEYVIQTSDDATTWEDVKTQTNQDSGQKDIVNDISFNPAQTMKRYIRFLFKKVNTQAAGNSVSVRDIEIKGTLLENTPQPEPEVQSEPEVNPQPQAQPEVEEAPKTLTNLALNRPITTSGNENTTFVERNAVDGNMNTRYASADMKKGNTASETQKHQWLLIDLGNKATINEIKLHFYRKVYATSYTVQTSATKTGEFTTVETRTMTASNSTMNPVDTITLNNKAVQRFIKFEFNSVNYFAAGKGVSIQELEIMGTLSGEIIDEPNPVEKLKQATLAIENDKVVIKDVVADDMYDYEVIGSNNNYVVDNEGNISNYVLEQQEVTLLLAAKTKATKELVVDSKINKTATIPAKNTETITGTNTKPKVIPALHEFKAGNGYTMIFPSDKISISEEYRQYTELFNDDLASILGYRLSYGENGKIKFMIDTDNTYNLKDEGYVVKVEDTISVYVKTPKAFNMAAVTLAQILQQENKIPKGIIRDYPVYKIRGMTLDVARIPMRYDFLQKVSKLFRWYKLNEYHLHFNDNQWPSKSRAELASWQETEGAHRLESKKFPSLNKLPFKHDRYENEYDFYRNVYKNPTYSIEEMKQLQTQLNTYGVDILAEFDTPGHSGIYSQYALENPDHIDYLGKPIHHAGNLELLEINHATAPEVSERAEKFVKDLVGEYLDGVFNNQYIHLGVDEYWDKKGTKEAFRTYLNMLNAFAKSKGKKLRTWGALGQFDGTTPVDKDIIFDEWAQYESLSDERIKEGYQVVNVPQPFTYVTPGRNHKDVINEQYVYEHWDPTLFNPNHAGKERKAFQGEPLLLGAKGALWGDEHREGIQESDLYYRLEKSLAMIGAKTWQPTMNMNYVEYEALKAATKLDKEISRRATVLVDLQAEHTTAEKIVNLAQTDIKFTPNNVTVTENDGAKWLSFNGESFISTNVKNIELPYTLEMTVKPKDVEKGMLLSSDYGAVSLNAKGRDQQTGEVKAGLTLNRYFYSQNIMDKLEVNKEYHFTFAATRQVLNVFVDGEKVATFAHQNTNKATPTDRNYRTSFELPFAKIGAGFVGDIKDIKVYSQTLATEEVKPKSLSKINIGLHKPVYDFRTNSNFDNQNIRPYLGANLTDGEVEAEEGRWNTSNTDTDYAIIDLCKTEKIDELEVIFDPTRIAEAFDIQTSDSLMDGYTTVKEVRNNNESNLTLTLDNAAIGRYVKIANIVRKTGKNEAAIKELRIFQNSNSKETLLTEFAKKAVQLENEIYVYVKMVVENKLATNDEIELATALVETLTDAQKVERLVSEVDNATVSNTHLHSNLEFVVEKIEKDITKLADKKYKLYSMDLRNKLTKSKEEINEKTIVTVNKSKEIEAVYYVDENGNLETSPFTQTEETVSFEVEHFSDYAVVEKTETPEAQPQEEAPAPKEPTPEVQPQEETPAPKEPTPEVQPQEEVPTPKEPKPEVQPQEEAPAPKEPTPEVQPQEETPAPKEPTPEVQPQEKAPVSKELTPKVQPQEETSVPKDKVTEVEKMDSLNKVNKKTVKNVDTSDIDNLSMLMLLMISFLIFNRLRKK